MSRPLTGAVVDHEAQDGRMYRALRFTAYGERQYVSLGAVSKEEAERELQRTMKAVRDGTWMGMTATDRRTARSQSLHDARARIRKARSAKLAESRQRADEAYSLIVKALQAIDRAEREAPSREARVALKETYAPLYLVEESLARALKAP